MDIHDIYKTFIVARDINCWKLLNIFEKSSFDQIKIHHNSASWIYSVDKIYPT